MRLYCLVASGVVIFSCLVAKADSISPATYRVMGSITGSV